MDWSVGDRVRNKPQLAHMYEGSHWHEKLSRPREGTVVEVPWAAKNTGKGTILVHWDSLTGDNSDPSLWQRWMWSEFVEKVS